MSPSATLSFWVAAVTVWTVLASGFLPHQRVLGGDFVQFYTLGAAARAGDWVLQYDWPALHDLQVALVPQSAPLMYRPSYPPLIAALYAPFAALPFAAAFVTWAAVTTAIYLGLLAAAAGACNHISRLVALGAALVFPAFFALIAAGQTTILPLTSFVLGWLALERRRDLVAGVAFSLVALKPNFGIALALVLLVTRSWRVIVGVAIGVAFLGAITLAVCGRSATAVWVTAAMAVLRDPAIIEPDDTRHTHALRMTLQMVGPPWFALAGWITVSSFAVGLAARAWRIASTQTIRISALLLATVIVSPHVLAYDAVLLAPACLWMADRALSTGRRQIIWGVVLLAVLFVVPHGRLFGVPLTVPLALWLIGRCR